MSKHPIDVGGPLVDVGKLPIDERPPVNVGELSVNIGGPPIDVEGD